MTTMPFKKEQNLWVPRLVLSITNDQGVSSYSFAHKGQIWLRRQLTDIPAQLAMYVELNWFTIVSPGDLSLVLNWETQEVVFYCGPSSASFFFIFAAWEILEFEIICFRSNYYEKRT